MQRVQKQTRKVNRWNAYLHSQVQAFNEGLDPAEPRPKVNIIAQSIRQRWDAMTEDERIAATEDAVLELEDIRESKQAAKRESRISTTRDVRTTLDAIETELQDLCTRTGTEILLIAVRSDVENFSTKPRVFTSSPRVPDFFQRSTSHSVNDFAVKLQAYCVADVEPPIVSSTLKVQDKVLEMKHKVKELINQKLQECAHPTKIARINYVDFETSMTERYGIVCENWPLPNFCAPGGITSLTELEVLFRAWSTGVTTFRKLSPEEHHQFKEARVQQRLEAAMLQASRAAAAQHSQAALQTAGAGPSTMHIPSAPSSVSSPAFHAEASPASEPTSPSDTQRSSVSPPDIAHDSGTASEPSPLSTEEVSSMLAEPSPHPSSSISRFRLPPAPAPDAMAVDPPTFSAPPPTAAPQELVLFPPSGSATFVFSTGKRAPPADFSVLGPMGLVSRKPRKKRADAGVKRGPNRRTKERDAAGEAGLERQDAQDQDVEEMQGQGHAQEEAPEPEQVDKPPPEHVAEGS